MKNIQIIDGAQNSAYDIYAIEDKLFFAIFPEAGQNIEFIEDFNKRKKSKEIEKLLEKIWHNPVNKSDVHGIHGTLFYELEEKREYYPTKKESDLNNWARPWKHL